MERREKLIGSTKFFRPYDESETIHYKSPQQNRTLQNRTYYANERGYGFTGTGSLEGQTSL